MNHLDTHNILTDKQHGFRPKRSTESQLIITYHDIARLLNRLDVTQVDAIVLDFAKAFDKVPHRRLILKLRHYGITGPTLHWITAFLSNRTQRVLLDGASSNSVPVSSGVPQGTVLGPLLFLLQAGPGLRTLRFTSDSRLRRSLTSEFKKKNQKKIEKAAIFYVFCAKIGPKCRLLTDKYLTVLTVLNIGGAWGL